eukprot:COSAG01_NODE_1998_length_8689_cov_36.410943_7_plen_108_part_00
MTQSQHLCAGAMAATEISLHFRLFIIMIRKEYKMSRNVWESRPLPLFLSRNSLRARRHASLITACSGPGHPCDVFDRMCVTQAELALLCDRIEAQLGRLLGGPGYHR